MEKNRWFKLTQRDTETEALKDLETFKKYSSYKGPFKIKKTYTSKRGHTFDLWQRER